MPTVEPASRIGSGTGMPSMSRAVALRRFESERVAVLGTMDDAGAPHLVPVTFALLDQRIVFAVDHKPKTTTRLRRLDNIERNPLVSFLVDEYDDNWDELWWVRVDAEAKVAASGGEYGPALDALAAKYHQYRDYRPHGAVVISRIRAVAGWSASGR